MAGLKKKKKEKSTSPNVVLVIFLVLFVITSITLGVLLYYANDETAEARRKRVAAEKGLTAEKTAVKYYQMRWREMRSALGDKLDQPEIEALGADRASAEFDEIAKSKDTAKLMASLATSLGLSAQGYDKNYPALLTLAEDEVAKLKGQANAEVARHQQTKDLLAKLTKSQDDLYEDAKKRIVDGNNATLAAAKKQSEAFTTLQKNNLALNKELEDKGKEIEALKEDHSNSLKLLARKMKEMEDRAANAKGDGPGGAQVATRADAVPLLIDMSRGKPLWDQPVGKITKVDLDRRQVEINIGSFHGAKPELTFNIFAPNVAGRAEGKLKGTIEIIKVLETDSSLARITWLALYDSEGRELPLGAQSLGRLQRDYEDVLPRKDDLLFNLFWGTRVAVTGYVSVTGEPSSNPAEQMRQMEDFMLLLRRNGAQVDAYVDLRDGQIRGNITSRTRYLIRGDDLLVAGEKPAPKVADDDKEKDKDKDKKEEPAAKEGPANADRNELVNKSSQMLRNDAKALGLLMISAENFANVIGYRQARSANSPAVSGFRPTLPYAGSVEAGAGRQAPPPPAPEPEKKAPVVEP